MFDCKKNNFFIVLLLAIAGSFLFVENSFASVPTNKELKKLATSDQWLKLYRYKKNIISGYTSQVDGEDFFFNLNGKYSPFDELVSFIKAVKDSDKRVCRFWARQSFLKENLQIVGNINKSDCESYLNFRKGFKKIDKAYIVFSSYHLDSPASAFGHSFLRLGSSSNNQLLDIGINYAANVTTDNPAMYAFMGIIGGFEGQFTAMPYFYKIREYNDHESRDIWSYQIKLTKNKLNYLIDHIWEMIGTHLDYFYFTENCSYHILALLDATLYEQDFIDNTSSFVIPVDTIKILKEKKILLTHQYRPSARLKFMEQWKKLTKSEKKHVFSIINSHYKIPDSVSNLNKTERAKIIENSISHLDYVHSKEVLLEDKKWTKIRNDLLISRAKLGFQKTFKKKLTSTNDPLKSHKSGQVYGSYISLKNEKYSAITFRPSLHNPIDFPIGQKQFSGLEMGKISLLYRDNELKIGDASIFNILSLQEVSDIEFPLSFQVALEQVRDNLQECSFCLEQRFEGHGGASIFYKNFSFYALSGGRIFHSFKLEDSLQLWPGVRIGSLFQSEYFSLKLEQRRFFRFFENKDSIWETILQSSIHSTNRFLNFEFKRRDSVGMFSASLGIFF